MEERLEVELGGIRKCIESVDHKPPGPRGSTATRRVHNSVWNNRLGSSVLIEALLGFKGGAGFWGSEAHDVVYSGRESLFLVSLGRFFFFSRVSLRALRYGTGRSTWDADGCHDIV